MHETLRPKSRSWPSNVPETWTTSEAQFVLDPVNRAPRPNDEIVTAFRDGQVTLRSNRREDGFTNAVKEIGYQHIAKGDLVVHAMDGGFGAIGVSDSAGKASPVVHAYTSSRCDLRFVAYFLRAAVAVGWIAANGKGIRERSTQFDRPALAKLKISYPSLGAQQRIADYLDRETGEIDAMNEKLGQLAEHLRGRRQTAISVAVSRGINVSAPFVDANIPGAHIVPRHWDIVPLQLAFSFQEGPGILAVDFRDEGIPLLRISSLRERSAKLDGCNYLDPEAVARRWSHFRVDLGDLLISSSASMGSVSEVGEDVVGAVPYTGIIRIKPGRMLKEFIRWFVVSGEFLEQVELLKTGSTIQHYGPSHLSLMRVALPPENEQRHIADHLDHVTSRIDQMLATVAELKSILTERRAALITEVVTGRKEVA